MLEEEAKKQKLFKMLLKALIFEPALGEQPAQIQSRMSVNNRKITNVVEFMVKHYPDTKEEFWINIIDSLKY